MPFELGFFLGMSLIISIGAQNLFVIRQGLQKQHSILIPTICSLSDMVLILFSVTTIGNLILHITEIKNILLSITAIFLLIHGGQALYSGIFTKENKLDFHNNASNVTKSCWKIIIITLGFSLLNPQAIMEMTVIMGGVAGHFHQDRQWQFVLGAILASTIWFFTLTWVSRLFSRLILNPKVWRGLEILSGVIMLMIAMNCSIMIYKDIVS